MEVFGSVCFFHTPDHLRKKLDPKSRKAIFVGCPLESEGCKLYEVDAKRFTRYSDVVLHKRKFHTFDEVANGTFFYEDNVDNETQPMMSVMS